MSKTIRISEGFHELVTAHNREGETMEETLRRLVGGPDPRVLRERELIGGDEEAAEEMREGIERKREASSDRRASLRERFDG